MSLKKGLITLIGIRSQHLNRIKNILPYFKIVLIAYAVIIILYVIFFGLLSSSTCKILDGLFGASFGISFSASLLEDLIIFLLLGLLVTIISIIISTKTPEEYVFDDRVKAIMNGDNVKGNKQLEMFLNYNTRTILCFNRKIDILITIDDYDSTHNLYKISSDNTVILTNICKDYPYYPESPYASVYPDGNVNGDFGHISYLATIDAKTNAPKQELVNTITRFPDAGPQKIKVNMDIEPNEELGWRTSYTIWNPQDNNRTNEKAWYYILTDRYSQNINITIENKIVDHSLKFECQHFKSRSQQRIPIVTVEKIEYNSKKMVSLSETYPSDKIEFLFYKPERSQS